MRELKLIIPGTVRTIKNHKVPIAVPAKGETRWQFKFSKLGWVSARVLLISSPQYKKWEKEAREAVQPFLDGENMPTTNPVSIVVHFFFKGRRPDLTGALESIGDCLQGYVWENDAQIERIMSATITHDKENPRTEITVRY